MDLIESRSLQAKCIINLMTVVAKDHLSVLENMDLPQKAYEIGCLVGMLEGEIFQERIDSDSIITDLPFTGEIREQFVNGVTVIIQQLLVDKNKAQLDADQQRLRNIRDEIQHSIEHTENLLNNVGKLEKALSSSKLFGDTTEVLEEFRERVDTMRSMSLIKDQERQVLDLLIEKNSLLLEKTDQSLARLPAMKDTFKLLADQRQMLALENHSETEQAPEGTQEVH